MKRDFLALGEKSGTVKLSVREKEQAVCEIKQIFEQKLRDQLTLQRISAPLFVDKDSGVQDNLSGVERPIAFQCKTMRDRSFEIVQSLAKWKRLALHHYGFRPGEGLVTDMRAIRPDEEKLTPIHSIFVDQWDWEKVIDLADRHLETLKTTVSRIYQAIWETHREVGKKFGIVPFLPPEITFVHSEELQRKYPQLTPKEREYQACREFGAVFVIGIGGELVDGKPHDLRAPDYDDWTTPTSDTTRGLNGDILVWNPILGDALELSSMGIRVDPDTLLRQLDLASCPERKAYPWHDRLLKGELPQTIGGGIGQSRLCMFMLQCAHIGEVQNWSIF